MCSHDPPDPRLLIRANIFCERVAWSDAEVRQRDDKCFFGALRRRHIAGDPTLVAHVEHALDEQHTIRSDLQALWPQRADEIASRVAGIGSCASSLFIRSIT
jgi:hypothetical protein